MKSKNRYVFDTGVLVGAVLFPDSIPGKALQEALRQGRLLLSQSTTQEVAEVLNRPKFDRYVHSHTRKRFLAALVREALIVQTSLSLAVCRDPEDDKFLELAVSGNASFLVTGDQDLLVLHPFRGIPIVPPAVFLAALPL
jgi:uncharacterized protein